jgi:multidrug efflux pump subunit AcrA (membrane-fusion protein)
MAKPVKLDECTEFRRVLQANPGRLFHATVALTASLVVGAVVWMAVTDVDLVVAAEGRTRPVGNTQTVKARFAGRVVSVAFREGDVVAKGAVLVQLDTERLDTDIRKRDGAIRAADVELKKDVEVREVMDRRFAAELATDDAKMKAAKEEYDATERRRVIDLAQAENEVAQTIRDRERLHDLFRRNAGSEGDWERAKGAVSEAETKRAKAKIPTDSSRFLVMERELAQARETHRGKVQEWEQRHRQKVAEAEGLRRDLENLKWERDQASIRMPKDGVVTGGELKEGELVQADQVVAEIAAQRGLQYEVTVRSEDIGALRVGMPARIKLDAFDYQQFGTLEGTVCFLSSDSRREKDGPPRYVVRIALAAEDVGRGEVTGRVKLGMAGHAEIVTERRTVLSLLTRKIRQSVRLS